MKLISWNVNGLRAVHKKGFGEWFEKESADFVCLQEIKVTREALAKTEDLLHPGQFESVWHSAEKPGYSGLVTYSRKEPIEVRAGLGHVEIDREGRWLETDFKLSDFGAGAGEMTLINSYFPNSQRDHARLGYKLDFLRRAKKRLEILRAEGRTVLLCGDLNIAHREIDLRNPKPNMKNAGFLPEERAWMDEMIDKLGWLDTFRLFEPAGGHYTWWSQRPGVREKNIGWRLDYFLANPEGRDRIQAASHGCDVRGSDHCPVRLSLKT